MFGFVAATNDDDDAPKTCFCINSELNFTTRATMTKSPPSGYVEALHVFY